MPALAHTPTGQAVLAHGGETLKGALAGGGIRQAAAAVPSAAARQALLAAYQVGFSTTLNHLMLIGALVAFVGCVGSFALVRQRDFVPSHTTQPAPNPRDTSPSPAQAT